jgi:hypothetical protein
MPDSVDLARRANYNVLTTFTMPDGFHQYRGTEPLEIPFTFQLHAFDDEYCPQGCFTVLDVAAKLHALVVPIAPRRQSITTRSAGLAATPGKKPEPEQENDAVSPLGPRDVQPIGGETSTYFPVACLLDLIDAGNLAPGIRCVGYVKDVETRLLGPFLTPPSVGKNLPSGLEARFTFVHRPSHTNRFSGDQRSDEILIENVQAYANDIKDRLYNTADLTQNTLYQGFLSEPRQ